MFFLDNDLLRIFAFIFLSFCLGFLLLILPNLLFLKELELEKLSAYECGFDPFEEDTRLKFEVRFYLVAILFIIFDIEIVFLVPWSLALFSLNLYGFLVGYFFLLVLLIGFVFEWSQGALDWE